MGWPRLRWVYVAVVISLLAADAFFSAVTCAPVVPTCGPCTQTPDVRSSWLWLFPSYVGGAGIRRGAIDCSSLVCFDSQYGRCPLEGGVVYVGQYTHSLFSPDDVFAQALPVHTLVRLVGSSLAI